MTILFMLIAWALPPFAFFRRWGVVGGVISSVAWIGAGVCAAYLWAGPGLMGLFVLSTLAGALELSAQPRH